MSVRAPVGDVNFNPFSKICIGRGLAAIRPSTRIKVNYLFEIISQNKELFKGKQGATFEAITRNDLIQIKIPLPPIDIQQKIVDEIAVLDAKEQKTKDAVEALNTQLKNVLSLKAPTNTYRFSDIATLDYGKALHKSDRKTGEYPVMGSNGVVGMHDTFIVEGPCIIVGRKGSAGKVNYVEANCYPIDTAFHVSYNKDIVDLKYLFHILLTLDLEGIAKGKGIGVPGLNRNDVHALNVPIHSLEIQKEIVANIENIDDQVAALKTELADIPSQKQAILHRYLN